MSEDILDEVRGDDELEAESYFQKYGSCRIVPLFALAHGRLDVLEYMRSKKLLKSEDVGPLVALAVERGKMETLQWLYSHELFDEMELIRDNRSSVRVAAENGHLEVLQWMHSKGLLQNVGSPSSGKIRITPGGLTRPCLNLRVMKWLHSEELFDPSEETEQNGGWSVAPVAAAGGRLDILQWLYASNLLDVKRKSHIGCMIAVCAAEHGHLNTAKWLFLVGAVDMCAGVEDPSSAHLFASYFARNAASLGRIDLLEWLYSFDMLYVHAQQDRDQLGCTIALTAAQHCQPHVLFWLHRLGLFFDANCVDIYGSSTALVAAAHGSLKILRWLHRRDLLDAQLVDNGGMNISHIAASRGNYNVLRWLYSKNLLDIWSKDISGWNVAHYAAMRGHREILDWMLSLNLLDPKDMDFDGNTFIDILVYPHVDRNDFDFEWLPKEWRPRLALMNG